MLGWHAGIRSVDESAHYSTQDKLAVCHSRGCPFRDTGARIGVEVIKCAHYRLAQTDGKSVTIVFWHEGLHHRLKNSRDAGSRKQHCHLESDRGPESGDSGQSGPFRSAITASFNQPSRLPLW